METDPSGLGNVRLTQVRTEDPGAPPQFTWYVVENGITIGVSADQITIQRTLLTCPTGIETRAPIYKMRTLRMFRAVNDGTVTDSWTRCDWDEFFRANGTFVRNAKSGVGTPEALLDFLHVVEKLDKFEKGLMIGALGIEKECTAGDPSRIDATIKALQQKTGVSDRTVRFSALMARIGATAAKMAVQRGLSGNNAPATVESSLEVIRELLLSKDVAPLLDQAITEALKDLKLSDDDTLVLAALLKALLTGDTSHLNKLFEQLLGTLLTDLLKHLPNHPLKAGIEQLIPALTAALQNGDLSGLNKELIDALLEAIKTYLGSAEGLTCPHADVLKTIIDVLQGDRDVCDRIDEFLALLPHDVPQHLKTALKALCKDGGSPLESVNALVDAFKEANDEQSRELLRILQLIRDVLLLSQAVKTGGNADILDAVVQVTLDLLAAVQDHAQGEDADRLRVIRQALEKIKAITAALVKIQGLDLRNPKDAEKAIAAVIAGANQAGLKIQLQPAEVAALALLIVAAAVAAAKVLGPEACPAGAGGAGAVPGGGPTPGVPDSRTPEPDSCVGLPKVSFSLSGNAPTVAAHIRDAQRAGKPRKLTLDRPSTQIRRDQVCPAGTCPGAGEPPVNNSCDEYPL